MSRHPKLTDLGDLLTNAGQLAVTALVWVVALAILGVLGGLATTGVFWLIGAVPEVWR